MNPPVVGEPRAVHALAPKRHCFVVFEGLDGSGKTTCARRTAEILDAVYLTTPSPRVREYRDDLIASFGGSQEAAQLFYLSTVFAASDKVRSLIERGRAVVLDRYFLSTQAYAEFRGSKLDLDSLGRMLVPADLTVFVEAPLAIRQMRLADRGISAADRETMGDAADARLRAAHTSRTGLAVVGRFVSVDAGQMSPDEVTETVLSELRED